MSQPRGNRLFGSSLIAFIVVAVIVAAVNVLLGGAVWRLDLTQDRIYTLSDGTKDVLKGLDGPVTLKLFFNGSDPQVPPSLRTFARSVEDLLREYEIGGKGNIIVEKHDPQPDSDAADWARRYGVESQPVGMFGPDVALGLVAVKGGAEAVIPFVNPDEGERLEYDVTKLVTRVANPKKPVVGLLSSLPVMGGAPQMPFGPQQPPQRGWYAFTDLEKDFEVRQLNESLDSVDKEIDVVIAVHPKNLSDDALYALDQFVLRGGRLLAFLDPMCLADQQAQNPMMGMPNMGGGSTLGKLLPAWGVTYESERVMADLEAVTPTRGRDNRVVENPTWLSLRPGNMNTEDRLTAKIETVLLPGSGVFKVEPPAGVTSAALMQTSEASGLVDAMTAKFGPEGLRRDFKAGMRREALAVRLDGKFKTAFPDGKPGAAADTNATAAAGATNAPAATASLKEGNGEGRVVLVGDVDMLFDPFCLREVRVFGQTAYAPFNDNLTFFYGVIEDISGSAKLSQIRSRGRMDRPFDVVVDLLRDAQEQYMQQENELQAKLEQTQQRLGELQAEKGKGQEMVLSPEQKAEIERFRQQELETQQQLKQVRKSLRADIERLGAVVKAVNILGVPLLIGVAGIGFGVWRRNRR